MKTNWSKTIVPGLLLGFTVARLGFADFNELHRMLLFRDLRLLFAFAAAVSLTIALFALLRGRLKFGLVKFHAGIIPGAVLFGIGWAITGACPGVALIQVGQGIWPAWATLAGIFAGIWIQTRIWPERGDPSSGC
ncbi:MAG: YeeE/YedE thiosulfate transporter family protein [Verrucomicrobiota bacterium]